MIEARNIMVALGGRRVLDDISLSLSPGEVTAVIGPNGAGKSTLISCLTGLRKPDKGQALLDGKAIFDKAPKQRARRIGYLPQTPEVAWALDVRTLVGLGRIPHLGALGPTDEDEAAVERAMAEADVTAFADRVVTTLSGGERARVLIARALAGETDWLFADEPLAGLDPGHQIDIAGLFRSLAGRGRGVVLTLHDLTLAARQADRIVLLSEGNCLGAGTLGDALTAEILARAYGCEINLTVGAGGPLVEIVGRKTDHG